MIRIGFIRWLVQVSKTSVGRGQTRFACSLIPHASRYKTICVEWFGLRRVESEREISVKAQSVERTEDTYSLNGLGEAKLMKALAEELAATTVLYCVNSNIVDHSGLDQRASMFLVRTAIMNAVCSDISDPIERVDFIDLIPDMRAVKAERQRAKLEAEARQQAAWNRHQQEYAERQREEREKATGALALSFDLLYSMLNSVERKEAKETGKVSVKTMHGTFVVPITAHGLVKQYVDDKYVVSHCVVFQDYSIPVGDEAMMKVALLKIDPARFMGTSNKFIESEYGARRRA